MSRADQEDIEELLHQRDVAVASCKAAEERIEQLEAALTAILKTGAQQEWTPAEELRDIARNALENYHASR